MNNLSIITHPMVRVLSVPRWGRPPPPVIVIAAETRDSTDTVTLAPDPEVEVFYPGEGFEGVVLPECMIGRIKRTKQVINWQVVVQRTIELVGVNTDAEINPEDPQVARTSTLLATGTQVTTWKRTAYSPTSLVPPLDGHDLIPDCGGYFDIYSHWSDQIVSVTGQLPVLNPDLCRFEAERVRDKFTWDDFDVEYGEDSKGVFPLVRVVPLTRERLTNFVYPHDCSMIYSGNCRIDEQYLWIPPPKGYGGTLVNDREWRQEIERWQDSVDWWGVLSRQSGKPREQLAKEGSITLKTEASTDDKPTWQITVQWRNRVGSPDIIYIYSNKAESRLVRVELMPDGGFRETRQLWRVSWHPETGEFKEFLVMAGERTISTTPYDAGQTYWKVEAYEQVAP